MHKERVCLTKGSIKHARDCVCGWGWRGGGVLVSLDDGRGCGMSHIWRCLATARSCFHLTQRGCLDFIERESVGSAGAASRVAPMRKGGGGCFQREEEEEIT